MIIYRFYLTLNHLKLNTTYKQLVFRWHCKKLKSGWESHIWVYTGPVNWQKMSWKLVCASDVVRVLIYVLISAPGEVKPPCYLPATKSREDARHFAPRQRWISMPFAGRQKMQNTTARQWALSVRSLCP